MTSRNTSHLKAARPVAHHVGEKAGKAVTYDALTVQLGDAFLSHWQAAQVAEVGMAEAVLDVAARLALEFDLATDDGSDGAVKACETFLRYVAESAAWGKLSEASQKVEKSRIRRVILSVAFGDVDADALPVERGLRACYGAVLDVAKKATGRPARQPAATEDGATEKPASPAPVTLDATQAACLDFAAVLSSVKDGPALVAFLKANPMIAIAALRDAMADSAPKPVKVKAKATA